LCCGGSITVHQEVRGCTCDAPNCRRYLIDLPRKRALARRAEVVVSMAIRSSEELPLVMVPAYDGQLYNLPARRRRRFRDHLNRQISLAFVGSSVESQDTATELGSEQAEPTRAEHGSLGKACANCRGYCCTTGADHAWLDQSAISRYIASTPGIRPREVLEAYLSRLPHKSCQGSCVFHTANGCALPRSMRSDVCNNYYCGGLEDFWRLLGGSEATRALVVAMDGNSVARSGVVTTEALSAERHA
jgi:hypothetical protein